MCNNTQNCYKLRQRGQTSKSWTILGAAIEHFGFSINYQEISGVDWFLSTIKRFQELIFINFPEIPGGDDLQHSSALKIDRQKRMIVLDGEFYSEWRGFEFAKWSVCESMRGINSGLMLINGFEDKKSQRRRGALHNRINYSPSLSLNFQRRMTQRGKFTNKKLNL